jgi:hypothetical protein
MVAEKGSMGEEALQKEKKVTWSGSTNFGWGSNNCISLELRRAHSLPAAHQSKQRWDGLWRSERGRKEIHCMEHNKKR